MCNIAGYIGSRPAAAILIEMLRRQEGWDAGYYTGIATLHNGKIHQTKKAGDLQFLLQTTYAADLPGTIGLIHSRTPSGGGDEWAHPFAGSKDGTAMTAYVANGSQGIFADQLPAACQLAASLEERGFVFPSRAVGPVGNYPFLPDGSAVHMSDVMAQLITSKIVDGLDVRAAMEQSFCEMPAEIVGLLLSVAEQDCIAWSRINMPMFVAFASHGAYLASTPQAFPQDAGEPVLLPACSSGRIYHDHWSAVPYSAPPAKVASISARVWSSAYTSVTDALKQTSQTMPELARIVKPLFSTADCYPTAAVVYSILYSLQKDQKLSVETSYSIDPNSGASVPRFRARLIRE